MYLPGAIENKKNKLTRKIISNDSVAVWEHMKITNIEEFYKNKVKKEYTGCSLNSSWEIHIEIITFLET